MELPYKAEYAKNGRALCRDCKSKIEKGCLRLGVMVQPPMFDGKTAKWFHYFCFFQKQHPKTVDDIAHFESLSLDDQENIKTQIAARLAILVPGKKEERQDASAVAANKAAPNNFVLEYSKCSTAACCGCEQKIMEEEIRISKKDFESDIGKQYGGQDMWHHLTCFAKLRFELGYFECGDQLTGFKLLNKNDQQEVKKLLPVQIHQKNVGDKNNQDCTNLEKKKPRIKKPLNAFMLYMKEMRAKAVAECTLKESAAINQILGQRWHSLSREEQAQYYEKAQQEHQLHMQLYPDWSTRDNYGCCTKKKKRKKERSTIETGGNIIKKCRAWYGLDQQSQWCEPCRRKKKCIRRMEAGDSNDGNQSDDNLDSCGSLGDAQSPPDDNGDSLSQSLSSPSALYSLKSFYEGSQSFYQCS